jgi:hypothetical protein
MLHSIVFHTLGQLATGILLFIAFVPPSRIGRGFGRFHTALAAGLWLLALWGKFPLEFWILAALLAVTFFFAGNDRLYYPFLILSIFGSAYLLMRQQNVQASLLEIPAILVLGASSVAMLLGHWYLVAPKLPITYLKALTIGLIASLLIRSGLIAEILFRAGDKLSEMRFYEIYGFFFLQRVVLGLLLTLILSILTYFCVRIRSTQSATGILYVVVVFCLVGELIGAYLFAKTGMVF